MANKIYFSRNVSSWTNEEIIKECLESRDNIITNFENYSQIVEKLINNMYYMMESRIDVINESCISIMRENERIVRAHEQAIIQSNILIIILAIFSFGIVITIFV
jgi:Asp-tRNA(Asn)/Glu-tRNA(Gln) amidotransferase C subunit